MNQLEQLAANMGAIAKAIPVAELKAMQVKGAAPVSHRTMMLNLGTTGTDGTNRVKITVEGGKFMVRGYRYEETEIMYDLTSDKLLEAIKAVAAGPKAATGEAA